MSAVIASRFISDRLVITAGGTPPPDVDATDFITRAGLVSTNQKIAINNLVVALKSAGLWTKMRFVYPFVGGTQASCSHNLINSSFLITTWTGTFTFDSMGVTSVSYASYADSRCNLNTLTPGSGAMGVYQNNSGNTGCGGGDIQFYGSPCNYEIRPCRSSDSTCTMNFGQEGQQILDTSSRYVGSGFWVISRTSTTLETGYRNGVASGTNSVAQGALPNGTLHIWSEWDASLNRLALAFLSDGLSGAEVATFYSIVTAYQTSLGRQN